MTTTVTPALDYSKLAYVDVRAMRFDTSVQHTHCVRCNTHFNYDLSRAKPLCNSQRACDARVAKGDPNHNKRIIVTEGDNGEIIKTRRARNAAASSEQSSSEQSSEQQQSSEQRAALLAVSERRTRETSRLAELSSEQQQQSEATQSEQPAPKRRTRAKKVA